MLKKKSITADEARERLELLCVRGEHCRWELVEKMRRWGIHPADMESILDSLADNRFFDDARFATAFARDKLLYNRWGRIKISLALRAKRIDRNIIEEALDALDPEEYERIAREYMQAKARTIKEGNSYEGRTKLYRVAVSRGFESALASAIVKSPATWGEDED